MPELDLDTQVKLAIYEITAETGTVPSSSQVSRKINIEEDEVLAAFQRLHAKRLLLSEPGDPHRIRMAPPFRACQPCFQWKRMAGTITRIAFGTPTESQRRCIAMRLAALRMDTLANR